jgi:hypothetical protein
MQRVFQQYKLFNAKNFMAGLNKIVDEIGTQMADPFKVELHWRNSCSISLPSAGSDFIDNGGQQSTRRRQLHGQLHGRLDNSGRHCGRHGGGKWDES